jgi:hypothetical protein
MRRITADYSRVLSNLTTPAVGGWLLYATASQKTSPQIALRGYALRHGARSVIVN